MRPLRSCESFSDDGLEPPTALRSAENLVALLFGHISSFSAALVSSALTPSTRSNKDGPTKALRVVSYNVQRWGRLDTIIDTLARLDGRALSPGVLPEARPRRAAEGRGRLRAQAGSFLVTPWANPTGNAILTRAPSSAGHGIFLAVAMLFPYHSMAWVSTPCAALSCTNHTPTPSPRRLAGGSIIGFPPHPARRFDGEMGTIRRVLRASTTSPRTGARSRPAGWSGSSTTCGGDSKAMLVVGDLNALSDEAKWDRLDAIHEENGWAPPEDLATVPGGALHTFLENGWVGHVSKAPA